MFFKQRGYTLKLTIGVFVLLAVILTAVACGISAIKANKSSLKSTYLQNNFQYAKKISAETNNVIKDMQANIESIAKKEQKGSVSQEELDILLKANKNYFNSIFIADEKRIVNKISPSVTGVKVGSELTSPAAYNSTGLRKPLISKPYIGKSNRLILLISSPIFDKSGEYKGFVGGSIYLQEDNILSSMLTDHFFGNGSYLYVVDQEGHLIFHPDKGRIGESVLKKNIIVQKISAGKSGSQQARNSAGNDYLVGYSYVPETGWGIISQTPVSVLESPLKGLVKDIAILALPLILLILVFAWVISNRISKPLHELAVSSEQAISSSNRTQKGIPKPKSNIYEVKQLYHHLNRHINLLHKEIQIDGLTGLANRKAFDQTISDWVKHKVSFGLILLDIDHFKKVNDSLGHLVGDDVLRFLANELEKITYGENLCFRYGGEEFGILIKSRHLSEVYDIAEKLRKNVESKVTPTGGFITVSIGIAMNEYNQATSNNLIKAADIALYESKTLGRNRTTAFSA